ncbi:transporter substrate-binding domain-containing protein [Shewanella basaltis]|uniref:substrate-binding periplasmic protein n=1 Tax=Shewanella basaltis TaxID=472183 RepID=UPI00200E904C|nr:transporter substrate-binding domain-containing protein [Shewanella basaltis]MCL1114413.1 transporter substrate-binding domain-containing protein [Shewanella basaltis]
MIRFVLVIIIFASVLFSQMACAKDKVIFYTEPYPPFQSANQQGQLVGFSIDILQAAQAYLDFDIDIQIMPWSRAYHNAQHQPNTFIFSIANTDKRLAYFKWIGNFYTVQDMIYKKTNRPDIVLDNIDDINRYTLALSRSHAALDRLKLDNKHPNVYLVRSQTAALKMLNFDRVDLIYNNEVGFNEDVKKMGYNIGDFTAALPVVNMPIGIATHKDTDEALAKKMRHALVTLKQNGELAAITARWFAPRVATPKVTE